MSKGLEYFFEPRSVAVIGASGTPGKAGNEILKNIIANEYAGKVYPINPTENEIMGMKTFRSVKDVPYAIDLAVFIIPAEKTLKPFLECAEKKIPAAVISSGGYAEVDDRGAALQEEILKISRASGMRILGPNTSGLTSTPAGITTTFFPLGKVRRGHISYMAQTGNFATHTMKWILTGENFGVARVVGLGNKMDLEDSEILEYYGKDPETEAIFIYAEGFKNARRFWEIARRITRQKPIVILKGGRTRSGAARALSHTASLAGNEDIIEGAFRQAGIVRVNDYCDLINVSKAMAFQPIPGGKKVAILAPSGALGVVTADICERSGLELCEFSPSTVEELKVVSASWVLISNPVDMSAINAVGGPAEGAKKALKILLNDSNVDGVVAILLATPRIKPEAYSFIPELSAEFPKKPILVTFSGDKQFYEEAKSILEGKGIPVFLRHEDAILSLQVMCRCGEALHKGISAS